MTDDTLSYARTALAATLYELGKRNEDLDALRQQVVGLIMGQTFGSGGPHSSPAVAAFDAALGDALAKLGQR